MIDGQDVIFVPATFAPISAFAVFLVILPSRDGFIIILLLF
jgi:hypothetical protein